MRRSPGVPLDRWVNRRLAGFAVRCTVVVVPFVAALVTIAVLGQVLPTSGRFSGPGRYVLIFGTSWLVMALAHHLLHRLLPLAALLEMSLLFPERAPSRLRLARRAASRKDLDDLLAGRIERPDESTQEAAERILSLVSALSEHDRGTRGHSERVRVLTDLIAERLGLTPYDRDRLRWAALLHDIGKLYVPVEVLNKPAKPSVREWDLLRRHPHQGERIVAPLLGWLGEWGDVIVQHHEKFNGSGYPSGIAGREICLGARIVSVADAYDVMTAARAYKRPTGRSNALRELVACSGTHFDPDVVRALISVPQRRMLLTMGPISWLTGLPFVGQAPTAVSATLTSQAGVAVSAVAITGTAVLTPIAGVAQISDLQNSSSVSTVFPARPAARARGTGGKKGPASPALTGIPSGTTQDAGGPGPLGDPSDSPATGSTATGSTAADSPAPPSGATAAEADATTPGGHGTRTRPAGAPAKPTKPT
ncbi:MAG: hypothetical protein QG622_1280, partial [Actinomycetota bacterium]|nr:hypothetical protein [Actinomycetota bacterium]